MITDEQIWQIAKKYLRHVGSHYINEMAIPDDGGIEELARELIALDQQEQAQAVPVAWGAFYFGGKRRGKLYSHCETEEQIKNYIANVHRSDDSVTLRAAPLYTAPPAIDDETKRMVLELCSAVQEHVAVWTYPYGKQTFELVKKIRERLESGE